MDTNLSNGLVKEPVNRGKKVVIGVSLVIVALITVYIVIAYAVFSDRYIPGTVIDGINCGFISEKEVISTLEQVVENYSLEITDGKTTDTILSAEIDLKGDFENSIGSVEKQNKLLWGLGLFKKTELVSESKVSFNSDKLTQKINELKLVSGENVTDCVNARLELKDDKFEIIPETYGTRLNREEFSKRVISAVNGLEKSIDLTKEDFYIKPEFTADSEAVINAKDTVNKWLEAVITYKFGSNTEVVDADVFKDWIVIGTDFNPFFDGEKVGAFVRELSRKYDTFGETRTIPTTYGFNVTVAGGNYGYRINRKAEVSNLVADIKTGKKLERTPDYYQEGASYDGLDIGNTYVEIDLTGQHLFLYKNGNMVLQTEIVSGHPVKGVTPNGTYRITYCERNATLKGEDYETPVAYWMPFNGDIGMHDAEWQPKFGGDWYVKHGSHGCINLPLSMAEKIYSYAYTGMPVVCYRYGTEHYNAVSNYRKSQGLKEIFDLQPEPAAENTSSVTETTTQKATAAT